MTAPARQEEVLHLSPARCNAQRPFRHPLLIKTKSLPSLPQLRELLDTSLHVPHRPEGEEDSLSSLEDPDEWRSFDKKRLFGLSKRDPKDCRLLLSQTQRLSLENSDGNMSISNDAPVMPFRRRSLLRTDDQAEDVNVQAIERLQQLSMSAPNLRFHMSSQFSLDDDDDDAADEETQPLTVVTPTRRRNPDHADRDYPKSPVKTVQSQDSSRSEPRILLSRQQARSFSRRDRLERNRSASPGARQAQRASSTDGQGLRRRARIRVRSLRLDLDSAAAGFKDKNGVLQFERENGDSPTKEPSEQQIRSLSKGRPVIKRTGSTRQTNLTGSGGRRPLQRSDSKSRTSPFRAKLQVSRRKLIEKLVDAGVSHEQHEEMMAKMGFGLDFTEFNQSAEF